MTRTDVVIEEFRARLLAIPSIAREALSSPMDVVALVSALGHAHVTACGAGGSALAAEMFVRTWTRAGRTAQTVAPFDFVDERPSLSGGACVLFSQGLSPNAQLVLKHRARFDQTILFTSLTHEERGARVPSDVRVIELPGAHEEGFLVRHHGIVSALVATHRVAEALGESTPSADEFLDALSGAEEQAETLNELLDPEWGDCGIAFVCGSSLSAALRGLGWRVMESLFVPEPAVYDVLNVAHGPLQAMTPRPTTWIVVDTLDVPVTERWFEALVRCLPDSHRAVRLRSRLSSVAGLAHVVVTLDHLLLRHLERHPRPLRPWPSYGKDAPLYDFGR